MREPLINILIRTTKGREEELMWCLASVCNQTYKNIRIIVCMDYSNEYVVQNLLNGKGVSFEIIRATPTGVPFHWNFYCNNLKEHVTEGWFFYCDDDDWLANPYCLDNIAQHLTNPNEGVICQFNRGTRAKPNSSNGDIMVNVKVPSGDRYIQPESIIRGKIGGSCIFLHHSQKDIAMWDGKRAADYRFIKAVSEKIPLKWVPIVIVQAGNKGRRGK